MQTVSRPRNSQIPPPQKRMPFCANACIAAWCTRPARPIRCWAMSWTGPRGRIYLIKEMLEGAKPPMPGPSGISTGAVVPGLHHHLSVGGGLYASDRSGPGDDCERLSPALGRTAAALAVARVLPYPGRFRAALLLARLARPLRIWCLTRGCERCWPWRRPASPRLTRGTIRRFTRPGGRARRGWRS